MPGDLDLALRIRADLGNARRGLKQLENNLRGVAGGARGAGAGARRAAADVDRIARSADRAARGLSRMDVGIAAFGGTLAAGLIQRGLLTLLEIPGAIRDAGLEIEALEQRFTFAAGSIALGAQNLQFVRQEAERLGISFQAAARGYSSLLAAARGTNVGVDETREIFLGIAEASAVLRLSQDEVAGALRAVQQIMSKGTLQAEEIRGQLGERLPGAFQIAARAMGVTTEELNKMLERGEVLSDDFLPRFGRQLRIEFGEGVPDAADSAAASFARMGNALERLAQTVAKEGGITSVFQGLADAVTRAADQITRYASDDFGGQILGVLEERNRTEASLSQTENDLAGRARSDSRRIVALIRELNQVRGTISRELQQLLEESGLDLSQVDPAALSAYQALINRSRRARAAEQNRARRADREAEPIDRTESDERDRKFREAEEKRAEEALRIRKRLGRQILSEEEQVHALILEDYADLQDKVNELNRAGFQDRELLSEILFEGQRLRDIRLANANKRIREEEERAAEKKRREEERAAQEAEEERLRALDHLADLERSLQEPYEASRSSIEAWRQATIDAFEEAGVTAEIYGDIVEAVFRERLEKAAKDHADRQLRESRRWQDGAKRALQDYADSATDAAANVEDAIVSGLQSMEDALVDFVRTGKFEFSDLVDSMIADLARLVIRQQITGPLAGFLGGLFGGGASSGGGLFSPFQHAGGTVGGTTRNLKPVDPRVFAFAPRYHQGTDFAGLRPNEVPAILERGERVIPRGEPGGMLRPVINVYNQGGDPVEVTDANFRLDLSGLLTVDLFLDHLNNGGPIRNALRHSLTPGV